MAGFQFPDRGQYGPADPGLQPELHHQLEAAMLMSEDLTEAMTVNHHA
jgi:hypothetical protein